ncbi:GNAT family N-acetyltransferase [Roseivivax isoporae]|uniref:BioF2-like acetyltransferase domain-containing protein n=1 Tax=Roseivivax isoporae LMG 25204 TaxID=1449351 RepID=X7F6C3_9RHOB|nr:GNAT family N-acetyltransferase [Roseivivax isoporae]ETX28457.1 hypothetical protein RISW2_06935 [Roseivivax isoporae LMG 25204]
MMFDQAAMGPTWAEGSAQGPARAGTSVHVVDSLEGFRKLRPAWRALEARDPFSSVFVGHAWLERVLRDGAGRWRVYVVRSAAAQGAPVAICTTVLHGGWNADAGAMETTLATGGLLTGAELTGILCDPDHEAEALPALARALAARPWGRLVLAQDAAPARAARLAACFPADRFAVEAGEGAIRLQVPLPDTFETWLQTGASRETARRVRRFCRLLGQPGAARRLDQTDRDSFSRDSDALLALCRPGWDAAQGTDGAGRRAAQVRAALANALRTECLLMLVLREGDRVVGGLAHVLDHESDRVHVLLGGADAGGAEASIGLVLHAEAIRWAISHGFTYYDFGNGDAAYKRGLGGRPFRPAQVTVRRTGGDAGPRLDRATLGDALHGLVGLLDAGRVEDARRAAAQLAALAR